MKDERHLISDEYFIKAGTITTRFYVFGNSKHKSIKPRIQVELYDADGSLLWDSNYDVIPLELEDIIGIDKQISKYTIPIERNCAVITKWDNGAQKEIKLFEVVDKWNMKKIVKEILLDSEQSRGYLAKKAYDFFINYDVVMKEE